MYFHVYIPIDQISIFQWIDRELVRLERAIDRANIKGWRQEYPLQIDCRAHILINLYFNSRMSFCFPVVHFLRLLKKLPQGFFLD